MTFDNSKPVCVTGATGYVAGWIVHDLLNKGFTVHAPIRHPENKAKTQYLDQLADRMPGEIKYFKADLLQNGSYDEAMKACSVVFHTASPFTRNVKDPQRDLIDPAVKGTENVLSSVNKSNSVERVVLTSSCASIYGDNQDLEKTKNGKFTEEDWNTTSSLNHMPYSYSKTLAEKKAWEIFGEQNQWKLVVINPSFVMGPGINPNATSESFTVMTQMGDGTMKMGGPDFRIGTIDVRDLSKAHLAAAFLPNAQGRHIISAQDSSFMEIAQILRKHFPDYPFPKKIMPKWFLWLIAPAVNMSRKEVARTVGKPWHADNSKSVRELSMSYRSLEETAVAFFQQLVDNGRFD